MDGAGPPAEPQAPEDGQEGDGAAAAGAMKVDGGGAEAAEAAETLAANLMSSPSALSTPGHHHNRAQSIWRWSKQQKSTLEQARSAP